ncbi:hypothetical protein EJ03DRAFT_35717 [Teratosphaeria nubilosa]|uniref:Uncharacterized protein n=1 Tax=Teratosphaeria nubilosa TaxID=161662 RepID=A0A6G1KV09_9PEZI|nr:hypothetical protein EJ03DRAFT_35717 [Teratosphaeria nubilosa]
MLREFDFRASVLVETYLIKQNKPPASGAHLEDQSLRTVRNRSSTMQFPLLLTISVCLLAPRVHSQTAGSGCAGDLKNFCQCVSIDDNSNVKYEKAATRAACADYPVNPNFTFDDHIDLCWDKVGVNRRHRPFCAKVFSNRCLAHKTFANCAQKPDDKGIIH